MPRLAVVLAAAALVVALLGATPLGNAAQNTVTKVARVGKSSKAAARGPRGPRGPRGYRGFLGAPGIRGATGPAGPLPNGFEARSTSSVEITGSTADTATTVLATGTLPVGKYAFNAQVSLYGGADRFVYCQGQAPGSAGLRYGTAASLRIGPSQGSVVQGTISLAFAATLPGPGSVSVSCWVDSPSQPPIRALPSDLVATTIGDLSGP